jgi:pimeloyl-ACP methyl ester carboxylesterase
MISPEKCKLFGRVVHLTQKRDAELVMLIRLAGRDGGVWDNLWERLAEEFSVANVDLGPPGGIEDDPGRVLASFADAVAETGATLSPEQPFHIVGWTGGTQIALQMAARHRSKLASMTLITPVCEAGDMRQTQAGLDMIEAVLRNGDWPLYTRFWFMAGLSDTFLQGNFDEVERMVERRLDGDNFVSLNVETAMNWMRGLRRNWIPQDILGQMDLPTLIIGGGLNRWHAGPSREMAEALHRAIPASRLEIFDDLGSLMLLEAPERVSAPIHAFLKGLRPDYQ